MRQALNLAINKQAIIDAVFQGAGTIAKNPMPPTLWSYNDAVEDYPYDPEQAKKLLEEAGVTDLKTNIWAMPVQRPYNPNARRMAELIQADWAEVGVEAEIVTFEWGEYLERSRARRAPDRAARLDRRHRRSGQLPGRAAGLRRGQGRRQPGALVPQAVRRPDHRGQAHSATRTERTELYEQAQVIFKEEAPWVTIAHSIVFMPVRKEVVGYKIDPFGGHVFYGVDLEG